MGVKIFGVDGAKGGEDTMRSGYRIREYKSYKK
jgi:hypothetical protein